MRRNVEHRRSKIAGEIRFWVNISSLRYPSLHYMIQMIERPTLKRRRVIRDKEADDMLQCDNESRPQQNGLDATNQRMCTKCGFTGPECNWDRFQNGRFHKLCKSCNDYHRNYRTHVDVSIQFYNNCERFS